MDLDDLKRIITVPRTNRQVNTKTTDAEIRSKPTID